MPTPFSRFASKRRRGPGCWLWLGCVNPKTGYGQFGLNGRTVGAHRARWIFRYGPLPEKIVVRHKCDNRRCVRLSHLQAGTQRDNAQDAVARNRLISGEEWQRRHKGKIARGFALGQTKLSEKTIKQMRKLRAAGWSGVQIAKMYHVSQPYVSRVTRGERRKEG